MGNWQQAGGNRASATVPAAVPPKLLAACVALFAACVALFALTLLSTGVAAQDLQARKRELTGSVKIGDFERGPAQKRLVGIREFLAAEQWDEAVETLRQVMEEHGDQVLPIAPRRFITVRDYCQSQLARLGSEAPQAFQLYRQRVDPLAERWYKEGIANRDERRLRQVVDTMLCSAWGDDALFALGEMALARGHYGAARDDWERMSPLLRTADGRPLWIELRGRDLDAEWESIKPLLTVRGADLAWVPCYETDFDLADIRARLVLVSILEGSFDRAAIELAVLAKLHPSSVGVWGGESKPHVARLTEMLAAARAQQPVADDRHWPTFAGAQTRTRNAAAATRMIRPAWKEPIQVTPVLLDASVSIVPTHPRVAEKSSLRESQTQLLSYHPVVVDDLLLVNGPKGVRAFDLHTGEPAWNNTHNEKQKPPADERGQFFANEITPQGSFRAGRVVHGVPRFTMTARDGKLLARVGDPITSWVAEGLRDAPDNYLACFDLTASGRVMWKASPRNPQRDRENSDRWTFEGSPISDGTHVYAAMRKSGAPSQAHVASFDGQTGALRWRKKICEAQAVVPDGFGAAEADEISHHLLTLAEGTIYFNTNLGAVAALRATDGEIRWIYQYERAEERTGEPADHLQRDLTPCIYDRGIIVAAPQDSPFVIGLDATTGQKLWDSNLPKDIVHLLGVHGDNLIASGRNLWWLNIRSGKLLRFWPEGGSGLQGYGRGILAGGEIFWPVFSGGNQKFQIVIFDAERAVQTQDPILLDAFDATAGNLVMAGGYLIIAGPERIYGFEQTPLKQPASEQKISAGDVIVPLLPFQITDEVEFFPPGPEFRLDPAVKARKLAELEKKRKAIWAK